jgi:hypothetical protein
VLALKGGLVPTGFGVIRRLDISPFDGSL